MLRRIISIITLALIPSFAFAQNNSWTGWHGGFHAGFARSNFDHQVQNGNRFCYTETRTSGDGVASADCTFTGNSVTVDVSAGSGGAGGGGGGTATASPSNPIAGAGATSGPSSSSSGSAFAQGQAYIGLFDLIQGHNFSEDSWSLGGHVSYDVQQSSNAVFGFMIDVTGFFGETTANTTGFTFAAGAGAANYNQRIEVDTNFLATARFRTGIAIGDLLPYFTAGISLAHYEVDVLATYTDTVPLNPISVSAQTTLDKLALGAVVGAGLSWRMPNGVILTAEGLYHRIRSSIALTDFTPNSAADQSVKLDDIVEARLKLSMPLN